jgi:hypothetical protein
MITKAPWEICGSTVSFKKDRVMDPIGHWPREFIYFLNVLLVYNSYTGSFIVTIYILPQFGSSLPLFTLFPHLPSLK